MNFDEILKNLEAAHLRRRLQVVDSAQTAVISLNGRQLVNFCSNNYLGLAADPRLVEAAGEAAERYGWGAGAAALISGHMSPHETLQKTIGGFFGSDGVLLFNSGYHANIGAIPTLVDREGEIFSDVANHASIIDACRLSKVPVSIYRHCDPNHLEELLKRPATRRPRLIITESLFSMDGDHAPLIEIANLAEKYDALLYIDEAHAFGTCGPDGRGLWEEVIQRKAMSLSAAHVIRMGTLGKAFASFGAFVISDPVITELLMNRARSYIFTTALPPAVAAASAKALEIAAKEPERRERLWRNVTLLTRLLDRESASPIIPFLCPGNDRVMQATNDLIEAGFYVQGIRAPSVPEGQERLRITVSAHHTEEQVRALADALKTL